VTSTGPAYQPLSGGAGTSAEVLGAVRSILTPARLLLVELPALSLIEALAERLSPSPVMVLAAGQPPARPDGASEQVQSTVTSPAYQPPALALVVGAPLRAGATLSMLTGSTVSLEVLSALSVAVPARDWSARGEDSWRTISHCIVRRSTSPVWPARLSGQQSRLGRTVYITLPPPAREFCRPSWPSDSSPQNRPLTDVTQQREHQCHQRLQASSRFFQV